MPLFRTHEFSELRSFKISSDLQLSMNYLGSHVHVVEPGGCLLQHALAWKFVNVRIRSFSGIFNDKVIVLNWLCTP